MEINSKINDFTLKGIDGNGEEREFSFSEFEKDTVILYFYPMDNTPGCTVEACEFRDNFNRLAGKATVIGVSPDGIKSHKKFQQDHSLNFILLSDTDHELAKTFGAWKDGIGGLGGINRSTFLIRNGVLEKKWHNVNVKGHVDEVLNSI
jgi:peroxiredoxin Q/BCP